MNWIKCSDQLPDKPMKLAVLIDGTVFFGVAFYFIESFHVISVNQVDFIIPIDKMNTSGNVRIFGGGWSKASWFKEPSHWLPLPEVPNALD